MSYSPPKNIAKTLPTYQGLLGEKAWRRLHPAIRERFSDKASFQSVNYTGLMDEVYASKMGKIFAYLCRALGTPLPYYSGDNIPTKVLVYPDKRLSGLVWERIYHFGNHKINHVKSTKCIKENGRLIEAVGCGFAMELALHEKKGALIFESTKYLWRIGRFEIKIPHLLTPGKTKVSQTALDDEYFRFELTISHCILGKMYRQSGVFKKNI